MRYRIKLAEWPSGRGTILDRTEFATIEQAEEYLRRLQARMRMYIQIKRGGGKVGDKTLEELEASLRALEQALIVAA
jgi:hypothetical protein